MVNQKRMIGAWLPAVGKYSQVTVSVSVRIPYISKTITAVTLRSVAPDKGPSAINPNGGTPSHRIVMIPAILDPDIEWRVIVLVTKGHSIVSFKIDIKV